MLLKTKDRAENSDELRVTSAEQRSRSQKSAVRKQASLHENPIENKKLEERTEDVVENKGSSTVGTGHWEVPPVARSFPGYA
jgi:hypothetical protein